MAAIIVFFFSLQPTCFDLSYLECLSISDSHKAVEKRPTLLITFCSGFKGDQLDSLLVQTVVSNTVHMIRVEKHFSQLV